MKNLITFLFYCLSVTAVIGQGRNVTSLSLVSNEKTETRLLLELNGVDRHPVRTPRGEAVTISMDGGSPLLEKGVPDLPKYAVSLMIPETGATGVEITGVEYQDFPDVTVAPSKGNLLRNVNPDTVPYVYSRLYEQDAFYPSQLAELQTPYAWRDVRGQALWIQPVQYNPVTKVLRVYTRVEVRVFSTGGAGVNECRPKSGRPISRPFRQLYEKTFFNFDPRFLPETGGLNQRGGQNGVPEKMLILAKDEFVDDLAPFVAWKQQTGIHTTVIPLSHAGAPFDWSVYNFVKQYYETNDITYLLIVGDEKALEPQLRPSGSKSYACENCYGYLDGDDHMAEVFVGRFHAGTRAQLKIMLQRNLQYEKNPPIDAQNNWFANAMGVASDEGKGFGDDNQADYEQANEWKTKHLDDGYEKCWEFYDGNHSNISPTPGDITSDQDGNPINISLVNLINNRGVSLFNYTGHGWELGLVSGNFNTDAVSQLRNTGHYPILISVACCTGNYVHDGGDCLGEAMQRAGDPASGDPWGVILSYCSSDFQSWAPPMEGQDGMNQYLIDANGTTLAPLAGGMAAYGNARMIATYAKDGESMADFWIPFGEPSLVPRTRQPQTLAASHPAGAFIGTNTLNIGCPVEGALVGLYWQGQTLAAGIVENGIASLQFPTLNNVGDLVVTVTQFNYLPYQGTIKVTAASGPFVVNQPIVLDDRAGGNNNRKADFGETINFDLILSNVGLDGATDVKATLSTSDTEVTILDDLELFGDIAKGTDLNKNAAFTFQVHPKVTDGKIVNFLLRIEYSGNLSYETFIPVRLQAPQLVIGSLLIDDSVGGNNNGRMDSGESVRIMVETSNRGTAQSPDLIGKLSVNSPWLSVGPQFMLGKMAPQSSATAVFSVYVKPDAPKIIPVHFTYTANAAPYNTTAVFGPYTVNPILETFESQNFRSFPWILGGNKPWFITVSSPFEGSYCVRSGSIGHNQTSTLSLTLDVTISGEVAFARRVSCEEDFDFLRFYMDDSLRGEWSGILDWSIVRFPITEGKHKLLWAYEKDNLGTDGQDRAWLDEIALPPHEIIVAAPAPLPGDFSLKLAPNPTTGWLNLRLAMPSDETIRIDILDQTGRKVQNSRVVTSLPAGDYDQTLDLRALPPGVYFVQVQSASRTVVKKVVRL